MTRMDVLINRPVVIVPGNSFSTDAFEANLGNIPRVGIVVHVCERSVCTDRRER